MKAYLAEKYMSGPKADAILAHAAPKKKKRKAGAASSSGSGAGFIKDDDAGWGPAETARDEEEDVADAIVASDRTFKKRRTDGKADIEGGSGWAVVRESADGEKATDVDELPPADEQPVVVNEPEPFRGGLLTSKQLKERMPKKDATKHKADPGTEAAAQETVYRDSSGRKIDMKAEKAEAARKKREREEKESERMEWGKGLIQRAEAEAQKKQLQDMRGKDFRRADDEALNKAQREKDRWDDPAAAFLTKKRSKGPRKPEYKGPPPPPNRFGIKPGYRWDGVDRSNGFEKKLFQKQNERRRTVNASHDWSVEDM
ncbi:Pre-mRNA-splicing factor of RES complex-domain-containing protein [Vararia minispora EC-137]|uniref:Pre-mRNA-splicing factor of RES complex-domain-containing protein n=1 Tax=Vararia minispora EC-137 TaxID=1314806 RepID=A0ACB8QLZ1_9AGAM|nr:Pre-mRNA-splicing factor of RES complex-domain-containing protein [Vararia minispora EC-137]